MDTTLAPAGPQRTQTTRDRLPIALKAGWGVGAVGSVTMMILINVMLLYYMVGMLGIGPGTAGLILGGVRLVDMCLDPLVGILSDRIETRWGRRRPWMLVGGLFSGLTTVALFWVPHLEPKIALPLYMGLMVALFYIAYSMFSVPYMAMPAEMTQDYDERTSIMSYRTAFSGVAGILGLALAPYLVKVFGGGVDAFPKMAAAIGVVIVVTMLTTVAATKHARQVRQTRPVAILNNLEVLRNRDFVVFLAAKLLAYFAISANAAVGLLFQVHITGRGAGGLALLGTVQHGLTIGSIPLWLWLARSMEKRTLLLIAMTIYGLATLSWLSATPDESNTIFLARAMGIGLGYAGIVLLDLAMLPDTTQSEFDRTGLRREGIMAGLFAGIEKTAFALAPVATGAILSFTGYVAATDPRAPQPAAAIEGIRDAAAILPAVVMIGACALITQYRLSRAKLCKSR